jgi:hypothetical protein
MAYKRHEWRMVLHIGGVHYSASSRSCSIASAHWLSIGFCPVVFSTRKHGIPDMSSVDESKFISCHKAFSLVPYVRHVYWLDYNDSGAI